MDPARLRVIVPKNLGLVLYCSSSGGMTSARVAVALRKKGISNVWVLDGGARGMEEGRSAIDFAAEYFSGSSGALRNKDS
jgi:rhodanese-related sulfurtransferase